MGRSADPQTLLIGHLTFARVMIRRSIGDHSGAPSKQGASMDKEIRINFSFFEAIFYSDRREQGRAGSITQYLLRVLIES